MSSLEPAVIFGVMALSRLDNTSEYLVESLKITCCASSDSLPQGSNCKLKSVVLAQMD